MCTLYLFHRSQRSAEESMHRFSTKELYRIIDILDAIQRGDQKLEDIQEKDKHYLNYLMDSFGIRIDRVRRSPAVPLKPKHRSLRSTLQKLEEGYQQPASNYNPLQESQGMDNYMRNPDSNIRLSTKTLLKLISVLNS